MEKSSRVVACDCEIHFHGDWWVQQGVDAWRHSTVVRWQLVTRRQHKKEKVSHGVQRVKAESRVGGGRCQLRGEQGWNSKRSRKKGVNRVKAAEKVQTKNYVVLKQHLISSLRSWVLTEKVAEARRLADLARAALSRTMNTHRTLATSFDEAEADLNQGFRNFQHMVSCTAVAGSPFLCTWNKL